MIKKRLEKNQLLAVVAVLTYLNVTAQRPASGVWFSATATVDISNHWQWHQDAGYRTLGNSVSPLQYLYRSGIRYKINQKWSTAGGIAFFFTKSYFDKKHHQFGHEFRCWQEVNQLHPLNKRLQLLFRLRTEQRFFAATGLKNKYTGYRFRLRPGLNLKLSDQWSLQLTDEYMQQAAKGLFLFDQNRLTFSGIYHPDKTTQIQAGYMWLKWPGDQQHILLFSFTKSISLNGDKSANK